MVLHEIARAFLHVIVLNLHADVSLLCFPRIRVVVGTSSTRESVCMWCGVGACQYRRCDDRLQPPRVQVGSWFSLLRHRRLTGLLLLLTIAVAVRTSYERYAR